MGNYVSCTSVAPKMKNPKSTRVIVPGGEIRQFPLPVKAAELMLESPNYFLLNSKSLSSGKIFSPLSADDDLETGNLYVTLPMRRMNSFVTAGDVAFFLITANSPPKRISDGPVKISPGAEALRLDDPGECGRPRLSLEEVVPGYKYRPTRTGRRGQSWIQFQKSQFFKMKKGNSFSLR